VSDDFTEKRLASRTVYQGRLLQVNEDRVRLPDGSEAGREYIVHPGAAVILPLFDDGSVLLERQYRYPPADHFYELPAGKLEAGEPPLQTAQRELLEETGYVAARWREIGHLFPCVAYSTERIGFFLAQGLEFRGAQLDEGEFLETLRVSLADALAWVRGGRVSDVKTMLGLLWAEKIMREGW
jgi:ADP-ribose pyrophosphatase